jgi:mannose-6-phosphate isomerase
VKLVPLRFAPAFYPRIWGSQSLAPLFPDTPVTDEPIGEAWLTGNDCVFASGPWAGHKVAEAWRQMSAEWAGTRLAGQPQFPLLIKYIFPNDKLSVQVHPNDDYARKHEQAAGGMGKTEMWYAVSAQPGAQVMVGLKQGVTRESFRRAIAEGTAEDCVEHWPVRAGDAIFVPAGTVHTIGPGVVLCEIQEYSDLTYRVYDYNRRDSEGKPRPLHVEKAFDVINFGEQSGGRVEPLRIKRGPVTETYYVACRYFAIEKWEFPERIAAVTSAEHFDLLVFLEGSGKLAWGGNSVDYAPAQVWMLPAELGAYHLEPREKTALLRAYVPDIMNEFVRRLADQRVEQSEWSRLVYP